FFEAVARWRHGPWKLLTDEALDEGRRPERHVEHRGTDVDEGRAGGRGVEPVEAFRAVEVLRSAVQRADLRLAPGDVEALRRDHRRQRKGAGAHPLTLPAVACHRDDGMSADAHAGLATHAPAFDGKRDTHASALSTPRRIWSASMLSNRARKLPSPKPSLPLRWISSKKIGPMALVVKICSSRPCPLVGAPSMRMWFFWRRETSSLWAPMRCPTPS